MNQLVTWKHFINSQLSRIPDLHEVHSPWDGYEDTKSSEIITFSFDVCSLYLFISKLNLLLKLNTLLQ